MSQLYSCSKVFKQKRLTENQNDSSKMEPFVSFRNSHDFLDIFWWFILQIFLSIFKKKNTCQISVHNILYIQDLKLLLFFRPSFIFLAA